LGSFRAELLLLRSYVAYRVLLGVTLAITILLGYVLPYVSYRSKAAAERSPTDLVDLLPAHVIASWLGALPFWFGMLALIFGVLMFGGDYGWGTLKTALMEQPSRGRLVVARLAVLALAIAATLILVFVLAAVCSLVVAWSENASTKFSALADFVKALAEGWLILTVWATFGASLAVISRGTALAVGLGILYGLVLEGLVASFSDVAIVSHVSHAFLRTNAYSLVEPLGGVTESATNGPGTFSGPFVAAWRAALVLIFYAVVFSGLSAAIVQRRDVT
jgi:ABC-type transport system involved in multi-copper enzyme maturation permease subunit